MNAMLAAIGLIFVLNAGGMVPTPTWPFPTKSSVIENFTSPHEAFCEGSGTPVQIGNSRDEQWTLWVLDSRWVGAHWKNLMIPDTLYFGVVRGDFLEVQRAEPFDEDTHKSVCPWLTQPNI